MAVSPVSTAPAQRLAALFASLPGDVVLEFSALVIADEVNLDALAAVLAELSGQIAKGRLRVTHAFGYRSVEGPGTPELVLGITHSTDANVALEAAAGVIERILEERPELADDVTAQIWFEAERAVRSS